MWKVEIYNNTYLNFLSENTKRQIKTMMEFPSCNFQFIRIESRRSGEYCNSIIRHQTWKKIYENYHLRWMSEIQFNNRFAIQIVLHCSYPEYKQTSMHPILFVIVIIIIIWFEISSLPTGMSVRYTITFEKYTYIFLEGEE